jgi:hypothetical protein
MNALTPASLVHFYDTDRHAILCGLRGFEHRSTKHSRNVTCQTCVGLLGTRPRTASHTPADAPVENAAL